MIKVNIEINQNKLEEFVRVLLPENYDILSKNSKNDVEITVNFLKNKNNRLFRKISTFTKECEIMI